MLKVSSLRRVSPWRYKQLRGRFQRVGAAERAAKAEAERIAGLPDRLRALATACYFTGDGTAHVTYEGAVRIAMSGPIDELVAIMHFIRNVRNG